jgi:hypothetical protein
LGPIFHVPYLDLSVLQLFRLLAEEGQGDT